MLASQFEGPLVVLTAADLAGGDFCPEGWCRFASWSMRDPSGCRTRADGYSYADIAEVLNPSASDTVRSSWNARNVARLFRQHATARFWQRGARDP